MRTPLRPALLLLLLLCGSVLLRSAPPRCPPLMLQLLRAPPAPLRAASATALSIAPHGESDRIRRCPSALGQRCAHTPLSRDWHLSLCLSIPFPELPYCRISAVREHPRS